MNDDLDAAQALVTAYMPEGTTAITRPIPPQTAARLWVMYQPAATGEPQGVECNSERRATEPEVAWWMRGMR